MSYYRVTYSGYIEGEYESKDDAENDLMEVITEEMEDGNNLHICVEEYNEETNRWE